MIRTEAVKLYAVYTGRLKVRDHRQPSGHLADTIRPVRDVPYKIPGDEDADLSGPLEKPDVLSRRCAFIYKFENFIMHVLDAGLEPADSGFCNPFQLISFQVRLGFKKECIRLASSKARKNRLDVRQIQDVIHDIELSDAYR